MPCSCFNHHSSQMSFLEALRDLHALMILQYPNQAFFNWCKLSSVPMQTRRGHTDQWCCACLAIGKPLLLAQVTNPQLHPPWRKTSSWSRQILLLVCHHDLEAQNNLRSPPSSFSKRDQKIHHKTLSVPVSETAFRICLPMQETQDTHIWSLGREDPLEEDMATHSSILAWEIPRIEVRGGLQSRGSQRVGHDWECTYCEFNEKQYLYLLAICVCLPSSVCKLQTIYNSS